MQQRFAGILVPVVTPFHADLTPDAGRWIRLCHRLLADGAGGLAIFGTTSEANSLSAEERMALLEQLIAGGVPSERLMPGICANSITEAAALLRHARDCGCGGVLMLPPFYYKAVTDQGLFDFFAAAFERAGNVPPIYLYHIPPVAQVGFSPDLIERLLAAFPGVITGIKDSSGDWDHTASLLHRFPTLTVFPGSELFLLQGLRHGAAGCISATANVNLPALCRLFDRYRTAEADRLQAQAATHRRLFDRFPMIPALKAVIAATLRDPGWCRVRPPLVALDPTRTAKLLHLLAEPEPGPVGV